MRDILVRTLLSASIVASVSCSDGPTERQPPVELAEIVFCRGSGGLCRMTVVNPDGSGTQTVAPLNAADPSWSRDESGSPSSAATRGGQELDVWNNDQSIQRLTWTSRVELSPAWSPDGTRIVFAAGTLQKHELFVINADGTGEQQLTQGLEQAWRPDWSPDGQKIAFQAMNEIAVMDAAGGEPKSIAVGESPAWSPDGSRIAFSARPGDSDGRAIWTMAAGRHRPEADHHRPLGLRAGLVAGRAQDRVHPAGGGKHAAARHQRGRYRPRSGGGRLLPQRQPFVAVAMRKDGAPPGWRSTEWIHDRGKAETPSPRSLFVRFT